MFRCVIRTKQSWRRDAADGLWWWWRCRLKIETLNRERKSIGDDIKGDSHIPSMVQRNELSVQLNSLRFPVSPFAEKKYYTLMLMNFRCFRAELAFATDSIPSIIGQSLRPTTVILIFTFFRTALSASGMGHVIRERLTRLCACVGEAITANTQADLQNVARMGRETWRCVAKEEGDGWSETRKYSLFKYRLRDLHQAPTAYLCSIPFLFVEPARNIPWRFSKTPAEEAREKNAKQQQRGRALLAKIGQLELMLSSGTHTWNRLFNDDDISAAPPLQ